jgi:uncharacterized membrane protein HdeD (DUF308 family)
MVWRGACAILFGLYAISGAWTSTAGLAVAFGIYGVFEALGAVVGGRRSRNPALLWIAAADGLAATFFLLRHDLRLLTFSYAVGAWAMLTGILELVAAAAIRDSRKTRRAQGAAGIVSIALGFGLGVYPELGQAELAGWLGATMVLFGCLSILAGARFRFSTRALRSA